MRLLETCPNVGLNKMRTKRQDKPDDYSFVANQWPLIPPGIYQAQCVHLERGQSHFNSEKLFLHFKITDVQYLGKRLFMAINLADNKGRLKRKFGMRSKLYQSWVIANNNQRPPNDKLSIGIFKHGIFKVKVRTVKPKDDDGRELPQCFHYSVADTLIERLA
jgi:hypothetical protein